MATSGSIYDANRDARQSCSGKGVRFICCSRKTNVTPLLAHNPGYKILNHFEGLGFHLVLFGKDMILSFIIFAVARSSIRGVFALVHILIRPLGTIV